MFVHRYAASLAAFAALWFCPVAALAIDYRIQFEAVVTSTGANPALPQVGQTIRGEVFYTDDPAAYTQEPVPSLGPGYANYSVLAPVPIYTVGTAQSTLNSPVSTIEVFDQGSVLLPELPTDTLIFATMAQNVRYRLTLTGPNGTFNGNGLPTLQTMLSAWTTATFRIADFNYQPFQPPTLANVTRLEVSVVPEPAAWQLALVGLFSLHWMRRSARRSSRLLRNLKRAVVPLAALLAASAASADEYLIRYEAVVVFSPGQPALPPVGATIGGEVLYSTDRTLYEQPPIPGVGPGYAVYSTEGTTTRYTVRGPGGTLASPYLAIEVLDNGSIPYPELYPTDSLVFSTKAANIGYRLVLTGPNSTFTGTGLPALETLLTPWTVMSFEINDYNTMVSLRATVTSFQVSVVPEPPGWLTMPLAAALLLVLSRRRGG